MLVNGLPALRVTEKGLQFRNHFSKQTEAHCKSDSWGEAKRPASRLLSGRDLGTEMSFALGQVTTKVSDKAQKQLESTTVKWNKSCRTLSKKSFFSFKYL